jgi:hypothetical protein
MHRMCRLARSSAEVVVQSSVAGGLTGAVVRESAAAFGADPLRCPMLRPGSVKVSAPTAVMSGVAGRPVRSCCSGLVRGPAVAGCRIGFRWLERWDGGALARALPAGEPMMLGKLSIRRGRSGGPRWFRCGHLRCPHMGGGLGGPRVCSRPSTEFERCPDTRGNERARNGGGHPLAAADGRPAMPVAGLDTPRLVGLGRDASVRRRWRVVQHPAWVPKPPYRMR